MISKTLGANGDEAFYRVIVPAYAGTPLSGMGAVCLAAESSFESVYRQWLGHRELELKEGRQSTLSQIRRIFGKDVLPTLGSVSIYNVRRPDLLDVLDRIEQRRALLPELSSSAR